MSYKTVKDFNFSGKRVLLRADFNVPIEAERVIDDERIRRVIPTIQYLFDHGAKQIIICTHLGRPKGKIVDALRVTPVAERLSELLDDKKYKILLKETLEQDCTKTGFSL